MGSKIRVGIVFGGKSAEHEISLQSAKNIVDAIDRDKYDVVLIGIDKQGRWSLNETSKFLLNADNPKLISLNKSSENVTLIPGSHGSHELISLTQQKSVGTIDVIFPILHGPLGEDGTIQGLLKLADIPFVGAGILGSAVGMDKDIMKRLLRDAGIPNATFFTFHQSAPEAIDFEKITERLGLPLFVKPANLGSSVGIHKVENGEQFQLAIEDAFCYDRKVIVEEAIVGRELECGVLGNEDPIASLPGEIITQHDFYSYEAKYIDENGARLDIPAKISSEMVARVQELAVKACKVLCCEGMARVDLFLTDSDRLYINEINTIPGFTKISMYPKLWEISGISYTDLIDKLIQLAIERFEKENELRTSVSL